MTHLDDESSSAAQEGREAESFRTLYLRYFGRVFQFFVRRGFSPVESEDLTQEAFLRVYRGLGSLRSQASFYTWLLSIASNIYHNELRRLNTEKRRAVEIPLGDLATTESEGHLQSSALVSGTPSSLEDALDRERRSLLASAIAELPPQMRHCVMLRVGQALSYQEAAGVLGISVRTVQSHVLQARERLKIRLGEYFANIDRDEPGRDAR